MSFVAKDGKVFNNESIGRKYQADLDALPKDDYGLEIIVDVHDVPKEFFDTNKIKDFVVNFVKVIGMTAGPVYLWGNDKSLGTMHDPKADGISAIQFIMTSSILAHCIDEEKKVFINCFSCKDFDTAKAKLYIQKTVGGSIVSFTETVRK